MLEAESHEAYLAAPLGKYFVGPCYLHITEENACATFVWGTPEVEAVPLFTRIVNVELTADVPPHVAFVDFSRLVALTGSVFEEGTRYLAGAQDPSRARILKRAMVFGKGLSGTLAAGIYPSVGNDLPYQGFTDSLAAAAWLGIADELVERWTALRDEVMQRSDILREIRAKFHGQGAPASAEAIARSFGMSARTMQRKLKEAGSSFQIELDRYRLAFAMDHLCTATKIATIARDLGFKTSNHFSAWFKKQTGDSPAQHRANKKAL